MKAVFTTKVSPTYDDLPEERYHFPRTYLRQAEQAIGDWIVYYEPRRVTGDLSSRGGRQAYFATAKVDRIEPDPAKPATSMHSCLTTSNSTVRFLSRKASNTSNAPWSALTVRPTRVHSGAQCGFCLMRIMISCCTRDSC